MEKSLDKHIEELMTHPGMVGVMCTDSKGLCLQAHGVADRASSGRVCTLMENAAKLHPDSTQTPVICVESDVGSVLMKSQDGITTALYRVPTNPS